MDFLNEVGTRGVLDSLTLNSSTTEDLALSVGFTAITVWENKEAIDMQWLAMLPDVKISSYYKNISMHLSL